MTTEKKKASNRKNARKSTGAKSVTGKAAVSQNARKHGLLSRHLIVEGESKEEFSELLNLLMEEFQPVGLVEHALVERVGIALWRQRRLVQAESSQVSLNQLAFGSLQKQEIRSVLDIRRDDFQIPIPAPEDGPEETDMTVLKEEMKKWKSLVDEEIADTDDPFANMPEEMRAIVLQDYGVDAGQIDSVIKEEYGSWIDFFDTQVEHYSSLILQQRILKVGRLVMQSRALPSRTELLARYQTALDNDLYKALKALRETQAWRQARAMITVEPQSPGGNGGGA